MTNKELEGKIAETFLCLFNKQYGTKWSIEKEQENPDFLCVDPIGTSYFGLEISLVEEIADQLKYLKGVGQKPVSPVTRMTCVAFDDAWDQLVRRLFDKSIMRYGPHTALLLYSTSILWRRIEWRAWKDTKINQTVRDEFKEIYEAGVWLLCSEGHADPSLDDLLLLIEPSIDNFLYLIQEA